jgi:hypothetical protein
MTITRSLRSLAAAVLAAALVLPAAASAHGRPGGTGKHDSVHHASVQGRHSGGHRRHDAHGGHRRHDTRGEHRRHDARGGHRRHDAPHAATTPEAAASTTPVAVATPEAEGETEATATPEAEAETEATATTTPTP